MRSINPARNERNKKSHHVNTPGVNKSLRLAAPAARAAPAWRVNRYKNIKSPSVCRGDLNRLQNWKWNGRSKSAAPTGDTPTASEWPTILLPTKVRATYIGSLRVCCLRCSSSVSGIKVPWNVLCKQIFHLKIFNISRIDDIHTYLCYPHPTVIHIQVCMIQQYSLKTSRHIKTPTYLCFSHLCLYDPTVVWKHPYVSGWMSYVDF